MPVTKSSRYTITLCELFAGDEVRVLRVLRAFRNAANNELLELDAAVRQGDAELARQIACGLAMACHLVGEGFAGSQLDALARADHLAAIDPVMTQLIAHARAALIDSIARASLRLEAAGESSEP